MTGLRSRLGRHATVAVPLVLAAVVTASASGISIYRIRAGDTLTSIAARYHTTVAHLVALNHLPGNGNLIYAGATLRVPGQATATGARPGWRVSTTTYVVRPGDSLYAVADRLHADPHAIARASHLPSSLMIRIGQRLVIPHRVRVSVHQATHAGLPGAHQFSGRAVPSRGQMASIISSTARRWGVDPRLALAVAWQESGFNQRWISVTGAVGAMQIMPTTGQFVSTYVAHRHLDLYNGYDNATAGVALLSVLLRETHHNEGRAAAGYYQGLASVQSRGMFSDTKRYVKSVLALRNRF